MRMKGAVVVWIYVYAMYEYNELRLRKYYTAWLNFLVTV